MNMTAKIIMIALLLSVYILGAVIGRVIVKRVRNIKLLWTFEIALPIIATVLLINYDLRNGYNEASVIIARSIGGVLLGMASEMHE